MNAENGAVGAVDLGELFQKHAPSLRRMLGARGPYPRFGGWRLGREWDFDDLLQDAFMCVLARPRDVPASQITRAYLFTVLRNLCIDGWRRQRNRISVELGDACGERLALIPDELEREHEQRRRTEALARYVDRLSPQLSRLYEMRFVRDLSQREAAIALGVSRRRIRTLERQLFTGAARELANTNEPADGGP